MARFMDHHRLPKMTQEQKNAMITQIKTAIASKKADSFGVTMLNVFMADDQAWGYSDAPNPEAIVKSHAALGVKISVKDVTVVTAVG